MIRSLNRQFWPLVVAAGGGLSALPVCGAMLASPSQAAVNDAVATPLISYGRAFSGGAYTNGAFFGGASIVLAAASRAGNTSAEARLLEQIRHSIVGVNAICANGGYPAQHESHVTGMFAIAKHTPRIWSQLTAAEKSKIDLLMKAALVASAFTTADNNPFVLAGTTHRTLDGDGNVNRDWNPNYREGMIGGVLIGMAYFGGAAATQGILDSYNHQAFVAELSVAGLSNTHEIFNWKAANPSSPAPTGTQIENAIRSYRNKAITLSNHMGIYTALVNDTYGGTVNAGLNNGVGVDGSGRIASGAESLPNAGAVGMLKEFDTYDGGGPRSSMLYCYYGYRPHQTNQLVLIVGGYWPKSGDAARNAVNRLEIGNQDLWYKMRQGYFDYFAGGGRGLFNLAYFTGSHGFTYVRSLWEDVLLPYHQSAVEVESDTDGDGTGDSAEILLGLNPFDGGSRFAMRWNGDRLEWPGRTGLSFEVQRADGPGLQGWRAVATVAGVSGINGWTDPEPPAGRAFYRIALQP